MYGNIHHEWAFLIDFIIIVAERISLFMGTEYPVCLTL
jgi:hypothetical protein